MTDSNLGGTIRLADDFTIHRVGFGAMRLAGKGIFGPPDDRARCVRVLRDAVEAGVDHIDTSDYYGPTVVNEIIAEALHPYPEQLRIVTKVGGRRDDRGAWLAALQPDELRTAVHDNLRHLRLDALDAVNFRLMEDQPGSVPIADRFAVLADLQQQGLIRHLGISTVSAEQVAEAQAVAPLIEVQNEYNLAHRQDDALVEQCAAQNIAYVPYFPLGGFSPLQSDQLDRVAERLGASAQQVALAWLLQRSPTIVLIPGTSSPEHLQANLAAADLELPADAVAELDSIAG